MKDLSVMAHLLLHARHWPSMRAALRLIPAGLLALLSACATTPYYDYPPNMPQAIAPEIGATLQAAEPVEFSWHKSDDAESYDFHVFNAETSDIARYMKTGLPAADICTGERCSINLYLSLPESDRHAWRVRASNMAGKSAWSRTLFTFAGSAAR